MTGEKQALISYRLERAEETLNEAALLFDSAHYNAYVNRLYYACFYAVSALLLMKDFSTSKHGYLRSVFHREFVKTGIIDIDMGKHFDRLFENRQEGDYADFVRFEKEQVKDWLSKTEQFIEHANSAIANLSKNQ